MRILSERPVIAEGCFIVFYTENAIRGAVFTADLAAGRVCRRKDHSGPSRRVRPSSGSPVVRNTADIALRRPLALVEPNRAFLSSPHEGLHFS
ncbi:hypothetical protein PsYK624_079140 [Phanerochaete sordida]|uniref:Uncharacterized protein n=1 Tax=Phanerochaete sordida TaxID=48140 RepID=A0A9P3GBC5_9APHY|nr:hypothetical protein PsYK624_079140 [Phanerochaete sordida]